MINEILEYRTYTEFLLSDDVKNQRLNYQTATKQGVKFSRQLLIIARKHLFHNDDFSLFEYNDLNQEQRQARIDYAYRALSAWASVNLTKLKRIIENELNQLILFVEQEKKNDNSDQKEKELDEVLNMDNTKEMFEKTFSNDSVIFGDKDNQRYVFFVDKNCEFPTLIDRDGNGLLVQYLIKLLNDDKSKRNRVKQFQDVLLKIIEWIKKLDSLNHNFYLNSIKGKFTSFDMVNFEGIVTEAISYGPLKNNRFSVSMKNLPFLLKLLNFEHLSSKFSPIYAIYVACYIKTQKELFNQEFVPIKQDDIKAWLRSNKLFDGTKEDPFNDIFRIYNDDVPFFSKRKDSNSLLSGTITYSFDERFLNLFECHISNDGDEKLQDDDAAFVINDECFIDENKKVLKDRIKKTIKTLRR